MKWISDTGQELPLEVAEFMTERHLATLSIPRNGRSPHVTPVGFTWDSEATLARVITFADSQKVKLLEKSPRKHPVTICQVDGGRWLRLEGVAEVRADQNSCAEGIRRYSARYRPPKDRGADRRVIEIAVKEMRGRV